MSIDYNVLPLGKGKTRKQLKARKDREDAKQLKAFRDAVWQRERHMWSGDSEWAHCEDCQACVYRGPEGFSADVHHIVSRRHQSTRYDPSNGILLCRACHNRTHRREF